MTDRIITNCEQCAHFKQAWDFERTCSMMKREIEVRGGGIRRIAGEA